MPKPLPELISPLRLAKSGRSLRGRVPLWRMQRLKSDLESDAGEAEVELNFGRGKGGVLSVGGAISARLLLTCQRCLQPMEYTAYAEVRLALVATALQAERLDSAYEPLVVDEEPISLADLVEDELILAVPVVPLHPEAVCSVADEYRATAGAEPAGRENPFAVLQARKHR